MSKRALIIYGTHEGQTRKICVSVAERLQQKGVAATLVDAADADPATPLPPFDASIVAASLHAGGFQHSVLRLVYRNAAAIAAKPNVFLSVSLSAAGEDEEDWRGLRKCLDDFFTQAEWRPQRIEHVAGAFRYTQYDYFKRMIMKRIAKERGAPVDTSRDWELTDWDKLAAFADCFADQVLSS
ncbi:MAG TPA: flavodoxin domain-containing protein [Vitreimonas sp.]|uniref:flavodoxin domain-containing protein n=1 Tax=Vitreimonas sp. TaxID=3069702 RepID=UPI002D4F06FC|nr:flavodoxin domain-containing protein [Vitreimonas sp.]HYD88347.1 flavodoxin domain-containing protein [Vitreimonas sp.]